ncbi:MAG: hypothetical protein ACRDHN_17755, partial [Thermomicrobiales bacterium]
DVLVAVGAGENSVKSCSGEYGGPSSGPIRGDLGDWIAASSAGSQSTTATAGAGVSATATSPSGLAPTSTPDCSSVTCDSKYMVDPATCECVCYDNGIKCGDDCCPSTMICGDGISVICACPEGTEYCNASCVSCDPGQIVDMGSCACVDNPCPGGGELCGTTCIDTVNDRNNCGSCGNVCANGVPCIAGNCICPPGYNLCSDGCKDLASDPQNCGSCGTVCATTCSNGACD